MVRSKSVNSKSVKATKRKSESLAAEVAVSNYADLVSKATSNGDIKNDDDRPVKRRRAITNRECESHGETPDNELEHVSLQRKRSVSQASSRESVAPPELIASREQTVYDDSESSAESDIDWNDLLQNENGTDIVNDSTGKGKAKQELSVNLTSNQSKPEKRASSSRLPSSIADKNRRLDIHKMHICCLLAYTYIRNVWCNSEDVQKVLRPMLEQRTISCFDADPNGSQFQRSRSFLEGLEQVNKFWGGNFRMITSGIRRSKWSMNPDVLAENASDARDEVVDRKAFIKAAKRREGSRDTGAQLFCALLRAAGAEARLVCSLQVLSLTNNAAAVIRTPQRTKRTIYRESGADELSDFDTFGDMGEKERSPEPSRIKRFGRRTLTTDHYDLGKAPPVPTYKPRKGVESNCPVFWVEAFNTALQKWHPVDPLVTRSIAKASKFEPPSNDQLNEMTYVIAFAEDGSAKDVTRRYAKAFNAKTRRSRVEATKDGASWLKKAMKLYRRRDRTDQDQMEDAELAGREASEPMPRNVLDFRDHPYYALERHLRRSEVIHPKREVGKLSTGSNAVEAIYRRRDVLQLKSADKWYRSGREIKPNETPLRHNMKRRHRARSMSIHSINSDVEDDQVGLYDESQTALYIAPPVVRGKVPRNAFGNLDLYVPSMIPPGAAHIRAVDAMYAARIIGVDFVDAVTGFHFKGRQGTAIKQGVIVAREYAKAMEEVIGGLRYQREQVEQAKRTQESLRMWKRFLVGLKVRERIMGADYGGTRSVMTDDEDGEYKEEEPQEAGGFFLDKDQDYTAQPASESEHASRGFEDQLTADRINNFDTESNARKQDYWEPTIFSPWDTPGMLTMHGHAELEATRNPNPPPSATPPGLFDDDESNEGGFVREDRGTDVQMQNTNESDLGGGGGGFIIEDENGTGGGGFVREADSLGKDGTTYDIKTDKGNEDDGVLSARPLDEVLAASNEQDDATMSDHPQRNEQAARPVAKTYVHVLEGAEVDAQLHNDVPEDSDRGSLLSHDPEDDDAEPDWLAEEATL